MAEIFGAGEGTLATGAAMVAEARTDFAAQANGLDARIHGAAAAWQGHGGRAFFQLQAAWTHRQQQIVSALDDFEAALRGTEATNTATDDEQSSGFSTLHARLG